MWTWFSNFLEWALVRRANRLMDIRMVRFWRSTKLFEAVVSCSVKPPNAALTAVK